MKTVALVQFSLADR